MNFFSIYTVEASEKFGTSNTNLQIDVQSKTQSGSTP